MTPAFVGTDYDGDTVDLNGANNDQSPIRLVVENDVPVITSQILNSILDVQTAGAQATKSLNGAIGGDENTATNTTAAGKQTYTFDTYTTPTNVWANLTAVISTDRTTINYYESALAGADLVYSIVLGQAAAGTYTFTVHKDAPDQKLDFNFSDLPSGQNLFGVLVNHPAGGLPEKDGPGLLVVGADAILNGNGGYTNASDTINTSKGGGGVTIGVDNQMFDVGDAAIFVFVDNPDDKSIGGVGLTPTTADDADTLGFTGLHAAKGGEIEVVQQQGSAALQMKIAAYDLVEPDAAGDGQGIKSANDPLGATPPTTDDVSLDSRTFLDNPLSGATAVSIKTVSVYDRANPSDVLESVTINQSTGAITNVDGDGDNVVDNSSAITITSQEVAPGKWSVIVSGFTANDTIAYTTEGDHEGVRVEGVGGKWDLGGFNLTEGVDTPDQAFDFSVLINDYDGDTSGGSSTTFANFHIGLDGTGAYDDALVAGVPII